MTNHGTQAVEFPNASALPPCTGDWIRNSAAVPSSPISGATSAMAVNALMARSVLNSHVRSTYRRISTAATTVHTASIAKEASSVVSDVACPIDASQWPTSADASTVHQWPGGVRRSAVRTNALGMKSAGGRSAADSVPDVNRAAAA